MNLPIAVLISGGGTTLKNLIDRRLRCELAVDFKGVVSSNPAAKGLGYAKENNIPSAVVRKGQFDSAVEHRDVLFRIIRDWGAKVIVMGGYLEHLLIPEDFVNRVVNIHPSLIPAFCGKGFYGLRVHQAVLDYGAKLSGCTVHFVDDHYDHGPIIAQRSCPVLEDDTPESLAARVFALECQLLPESLQALAEGRITIHGRRVTWNAVA
jgi:phosphoribosylglycinamide formyltransferase-1